MEHPYALVQSEKVVTLQIAGVTTQAKAYREGDMIHLEFMSDSPLGAVGGHLQCHISTFENIVEFCEERRVLPRALKAMEDYGIQPRLILPR